MIRDAGGDSVRVRVHHVAASDRFDRRSTRHRPARRPASLQRAQARRASVPNVEIRKELVIESAHIVFVSFARLRVWHVRLGAVRATKPHALDAEIDHQERLLADDALHDQPRL